MCVSETMHKERNELFMGDVINLFDEKNKRDMVPMEEWDGECWRTIFNTLSAMEPDGDPWDVFARFMKAVLNQE